MPTYNFVNYLWDDAKAASLDPVGRLIYRSNILGSDQRITNTGGGNTSSKISEKDPLTGAETPVLWVKGSGGDLRTSQSWMVGLQWSDVLAEGNSFGMGVGQPSFATATRNGAPDESGVWAWEWWYQWQLSDAISVTPAVFYLNNPQGSLQGIEGGGNQFGALVKTSFRF